MLRKTLVALVSVAALGLGSAAMAAHGGGGGGGHGGGGGGGPGFGGGSFGGVGRAGVAAMPGGSAGPMMMHGGNMGQIRGGPTAAPIAGRVQGWNGPRNNFAGMHNHHDHHRFHNRNFLALGFGGPIYDYAYGSCWAQVPTRYGWHWVYVCGDYYGY